MYIMTNLISFVHIKELFVSLPVPFSKLIHPLLVVELIIHFIAIGQGR